MKLTTRLSSVQLTTIADRCADKTIVIECAELYDLQQLLTIWAGQAAFPNYFGANLDALYDCLTDRPFDCVVIFKQLQASKISTAQIKNLLRLLAKVRKIYWRQNKVFWYLYS